MMQFRNGDHLIFELISEQQIIINGAFNLFTDELKNTIKEFGGCWRKDTDCKGWMIMRDKYDSLMHRLEEKIPHIELRGVPWFGFAVLRKIQNEIIFFDQARVQNSISYKMSDQMKDPKKDLPSQIYDKLYSYQRQCLIEGINLYGRILIADEMGVGKTIQSLCLARMYKESWPLLIICPSPLDEIQQWLPDISPIQIISSTKAYISDKSSVVIISYDLCTKLKDQLIARKFKIAIADEAHSLKGLQSLRSQSCVPLLRSCKHVILLTGTPALSKPKDLFNLVTIIRPDIFTNFKDFGFRYCDPKNSRFNQGLEYDGASNQQELHFILKNFIMIRRLKKDVLSQLPLKRRFKIRLQTDLRLSKQIQSILGSMSGNQIDTLLEQNEQQANTNNSNLMKCYLLTGQAKMKSINEYIDELLENQIKFIFFAHHSEVLDSVQAHLNGKVNYIRIDGKVAMEQRHQNVHLFQERNDVKVAILSITAASTGITLTAASTIVFGEMHWTPAQMLQAEDRAHRIGQLSNVDCQYLIGHDTLDDILFTKLEKKFGTVSNLIDGSHQQLQAISAIDLRDIQSNEIPISISKIEDYLDEPKESVIAQEDKAEIKQEIQQNANKQCKIKIKEIIQSEIKIKEIIKSEIEIKEIMQSEIKIKEIIQNKIKINKNKNKILEPIKQLDNIDISYLKQVGEHQQSQEKIIIKKTFTIDYQAFSRRNDSDKLIKSLHKKEQVQEDVKKFTKDHKTEVGYLTPQKKPFINENLQI